VQLAGDAQDCLALALELDDGGAEVAGLLPAEERRVPVFAHEFARGFSAASTDRQAQNNPARPDNTHEQRPRDSPAGLSGKCLTLLPFAAGRPMAVFAAGEPRQEADKGPWQAKGGG